MRKLAAAVVLLSLIGFTPVLTTRQVSGAPASVGRTPGGSVHWSKLANPQSIWTGDGAMYYSFELANGSRVHLVVVDTRSGKWKLQVAQAGKTTPTSQQAAQCSAGAGVNAGFFNLSDGVSASYTMIDGKEVANPRTNKALIGNPKLIPHLKEIFGRSEVRFTLNAAGKETIAIVPHEQPLAKGTRLIQSIQAGPRLLPKVTAREEAFLRVGADGKEVDSIGVRKTAGRTAFGITDDGHAMMVCIAGKGQDPESSGITLDDFAALLRDLGCTSAINFDGGASSTMFVRLAPAGGVVTKDLPEGAVVCGKRPETRVKSVLLLVPTGTGK